MLGKYKNISKRHSKYFMEEKIKMARWLKKHFLLVINEM